MSGDQLSSIDRIWGLAKDGWHVAAVLGFAIWWAATYKATQEEHLQRIDDHLHTIDLHMQIEDRHMELEDQQLQWIVTHIGPTKSGEPFPRILPETSKQSLSLERSEAASFVP